MIYEQNLHVLYYVLCTLCHIILLNNLIGPPKIVRKTGNRETSSISWREMVLETYYLKHSYLPAL